MILRFDQGISYYNQLLYFSTQVNKWNKILLLMVRFHMIILEIQTTYNLYFAEDKRNDQINFCNFWKESYILSSLKNIIAAYPFSEMILKKLGIFDLVNQLYLFLNLAEKINLFTLSKDMMDRFHQTDYV